MGARTNWELVLNRKSIWLYSHSGGETKFQDTKQALQAARPRWDDSNYALRIVISNIIGESWNESTGFGISTDPEFEEQYISARIDFDTQHIKYGDFTFRFSHFVEMNPERFWEVN